MFHFYIPWKCQKTATFSDSFKGYWNGTLSQIGFINLSSARWRLKFCSMFCLRIKSRLRMQWLMITDYFTANAKVGFRTIFSDFVFLKTSIDDNLMTSFSPILTALKFSLSLSFYSRYPVPFLAQWAFFPHGNYMSKTDIFFYFRTLCYCELYNFNLFPINNKTSVTT